MWFTSCSSSLAYLAENALFEVLDDGAFCQELIVARHAEQPAQLDREFNF